MTKPTAKQSVPAVTQAAGLAARAVARLEANAAAIHAEANEKRGFQAVFPRRLFGSYSARQDRDRNSRR
jgi:hypothetical protein